MKPVHPHRPLIGQHIGPRCARGYLPGGVLKVENFNFLNVCIIQYGNYQNIKETKRPSRTEKEPNQLFEFLPWTLENQIQTTSN